MSMSTEYLALLSETPSVSHRAVLGTDSPAPVSRRAVIRAAFALGTAALAASAVDRVGALAQAAPQYRTTAALNLRSGPGTSHSVLAVMPAGSTVTHAGTSKNGFFQIVFNGTYGWASAQYLTPAGGNMPPGGGLGGNGRTTAAVNFREGPSTSARVIAVLPAGTPVFVTDVGASGFWNVSYNGQSGWIYADYIQRDGAGPAPGQPSGETFTTTAALNLRAEPSTNSKVLLVMPAGAKVRATPNGSGSFRQVIYNGVTGWAHTSYLN